MAGAIALKWLFVAMTAALVAWPAAAAAAAPDPGLREELLKMHDAHQEARNPYDAQRIAATEERNVARLKELVSRHGWPTLSMVGQEAASAAWLLVHQAQRDPQFQLKVVKLMEPLVARKEVNPQIYAYLYDRTHKPQRYGTQGTCLAPGVWQPREMEDPPKVDERRAKLKLTPVKLREYALQVGAQSCK